MRGATFVKAQGLTRDLGDTRVKGDGNAQQSLGALDAQAEVLRVAEEQLGMPGAVGSCHRRFPRVRRRCVELPDPPKGFLPDLVSARPTPAAVPAAVALVGELQEGSVGVDPGLHRRASQAGRLWLHGRRGDRSRSRGRRDLRPDLLQKSSRASVRPGPDPRASPIVYPHGRNDRSPGRGGPTAESRQTARSKGPGRPGRRPPRGDRRPGGRCLR
jgi:hypothetical protein